MNRYEYFRRPKTCPECKSKRIASILYGLPAFSPELIKEIEDGVTALGGCVVTLDDPLWKCTECGTCFYKRITKDY